MSTNYWTPVEPVPVPLGPHNATHYGPPGSTHEFYAPVERRDGIPTGRCFCGRRRPFESSITGSTTAWCECGIQWTATWGRLGWVDRCRHNADAR